MRSTRLVFTTSQVAKICKVAPRTVSKWFDTGKLTGYRIPGSEDRRIPREALIKFLKDHNMPLGELEDEAWHKVVIVGAEQRVIDQLREVLPKDEFKQKVAENGWRAGTIISSFDPHTIIIDLAMGCEAIQIAQDLRVDECYAQTAIVALSGDADPAPEALIVSGFNEVFRKPFDVALLAEWIGMNAEERRLEEER